MIPSKPLVRAGIAGLIGIALLLMRKSQATVLAWDQSMRVINGLHSSVQPLAKRLLEEAAADGIQLIVTDGYRSNAEQERLYNQGRTTPGPIVTHAKPGTSWHNHQLAFDVAVFKDGRATWPEDNTLWNKVGAIGRNLGLTWGGDWTSFKDRPHFEYHPNMTLADAQAGRRPVA